MYNSIFVSVVVKIWSFIISEYDKSFLKKIVDAFTKGISYLSYGSRVKSIFKSRDLLIEKSYTYDLYRKFMKFVNKTLDKIRAYIKESGKYSLVYNNIYNLFQTKVEVLRTFFVFTLSFGIALALNNIIRGYYSGRSYIVIAIIVIGSIIGLSLKGNYKGVLETSFIYKFVYSVFSIEEGIEDGS